MDVSCPKTAMQLLKLYQWQNKMDVVQQLRTPTAGTNAAFDALKAGISGPLFLNNALKSESRLAAGEKRDRGDGRFRRLHRWRFASPLVCP